MIFAHLFQMKHKCGRRRHWGVGYHPRSELEQSNDREQCNAGIMLDKIDVTEYNNLFRPKSESAFRNNYSKTGMKLSPHDRKDAGFM